ncbi:MAG TPA: hypothetical protein VGI66_14835 [Streptosporangiaceae bacterium]
MKYATLDFDRNSVGGIGEIGADQPAEMPPYWGAYFAVADTDAAVEKAAELGGSVVAPAWDSPTAGWQWSVTTRAGRLR